MSMTIKSFKFKPTIVSAALLVLCASGTAIAEKRDCTISKQSKQEISRVVSQPGGTPGLELVQSVRVDAQTSPNPDFNGIDQLVYGQVDHINGTGDHRGHSVNIHKNGDRTWMRWSGTHKTVATETGSWETEYDGKYEFTGGTGKFASIKGGGTYRGRITPQGLIEKSVCAADY